MKSWWCGDNRVEQYMHKVRDRIHKHVQDPDARTDIYNRAYEAVYAAIVDHDKKLGMVNVLRDIPRSNE